MEETREELIAKLGRYFLSGDIDYHLLLQKLNKIHKDLDERLNEVEFYQEHNGKKPEVSRGEKMLLLHELGVLDYLFTLNISQNKLAELLSIIINSSASNIGSDLTSRFYPKSPMKTKGNYKFVVETFHRLKLKKYEERCQDELDKLED